MTTPVTTTERGTMNLDDLATITPLEAGPAPKECSVAWLLRILPDKTADTLRRALANEAAATTLIIESLRTDHGVPESHIRADRINHHRRGGCSCAKSS